MVHLHRPDPCTTIWHTEGMLQDALHGCLLKTDKERIMLLNSLFCFNIRSSANKKRGLKKTSSSGKRGFIRFWKVLCYKVYKDPTIKCTTLWHCARCINLFLFSQSLTQHKSSYFSFDPINFVSFFIWLSKLPIRRKSRTLLPHKYSLYHRLFSEILRDTPGSGYRGEV